MPRLFPPLAVLCLGIVAGSHLDPAPLPVCLACACALVPVRRWCWPLAVLLVGAWLGQSVSLTAPLIRLGEPVRIIGYLESPPEWRDAGVRMRVRVEFVEDRAVRGRADLSEFLDTPDLRSLFQDLNLGSGDRVEIVVALRRPRLYRNSGAFDYRAYLARQGVYWTGTIRNPRLIRVLDRGRHWSDRWQGAVRQRFESSTSLDPAHRPVLAAILFGDRSGLSPDVEALFRRSGLLHLLVVSGFNLAVVSVLAAQVLRALGVPRTLRWLGTAGAATFYVAIAVGQAPVIRAWVMVMAVVIGKLLDREHPPAQVLCAAAIVMLVRDPAALWDSSFRMTFLALAGILWVGGPWADRCVGWRIRGLRDLGDVGRDTGLPDKIVDMRVWLRLRSEQSLVPLRVVALVRGFALRAIEAGIVAVGVEIALFPLLVSSFHQISLLSPIANVPAGFLTALATPIGLLAVIVPKALSFLLSAPVDVLIRCLVAVARFAESWPGMGLRVPDPPEEAWVAYALAVFLFTWSAGTKHARRLGGLLIGTVQAVIVFGNFARPPEAPTLTFLDVGQGDSAVIRLADGTVTVVDGGGLAGGRVLTHMGEGFSVGEQVVSPYLWSHRIRHVDRLVLTHAHHDHMDGLNALLDNFSVGELWVGRNPMTDAYANLLERASRRGVPIRWICGGQTRGPFTVLHPPCDKRTRGAPKNDDSVVMLLRLGEVTALLTGDLERSVPVPAQVTVFKVPHHGSRNGRIRAAARVRVVSVGEGNGFGHPDPLMLPALRTDLLGGVEIRVCDGGVRVVLGSPVTSLTRPNQSCSLPFVHGH